MYKNIKEVSLKFIFLRWQVMKVKILTWISLICHQLYSQK